MDSMKYSQDSDVDKSVFHEVHLGVSWKDGRDTNQDLVTIAFYLTEEMARDYRSLDDGNSTIEEIDKARREWVGNHIDQLLEMDLIFEVHNNTEIGSKDSLESQLSDIEFVEMS